MSKTSYIIIIRGPLGVGKSVVAQRLAKILKGEYVSIDLILEKLGLDLPYGKCIPLKNFKKASESYLAKAKKKIDQDKIIIFDGNFYYKDQIRHLMRNLAFECFVFTLKAPLKVCLKRDKKRKLSYGQEAVKAVYKLVSRFDYGITINTDNKTVVQVVKNILSYLPKSK